MAIKLECVKTKHPQLHIESKIYKMMQGGGMVPVKYIICRTSLSSLVSFSYCFFVQASVKRIVPFMAPPALSRVFRSVPVPLGALSRLLLVTWNRTHQRPLGHKADWTSQRGRREPS